MTAAAGVSDEVWVGLDLGTQSVRAMAVTGGGTVVGAGTQKLTSHRDGPRHEQDPEQWWQAVAAASREALRDVAPGGRARGGGRRHLRDRPAHRPPTATR